MTSVELWDFVSTSLMTLFGFASSNSIALLSLLVAVLVWWQSRKDAKLAKETAVMSVKPHLSLSTNRSPPEGIYQASIQNNGVGPALIKSFTVYIDGQEATASEHKRPLENAVLQLNLAIKKHSTVSLVEGSGVSAGEVEKIFDIELHRENLPLTKDILVQLNRLDLKIEYTDLYGNLMPVYDSKEIEEGF